MESMPFCSDFNSPSVFLQLINYIYVDISTKLFRLSQSTVYMVFLPCDIFALLQLQTISPRLDFVQMQLS